MRSILKVLAIFVLASASNHAAFAAAKYKVTGRITGANGYTAMLLLRNGDTRSATLGASGKFTFSKLTTGNLNGASIQLINPEGQYAGMVVLGGAGSRVGTSFKGKAPADGVKHNLGKITLQDGYAKVKSGQLAAKYFAKRVEAVDGKPVGAGNLGVAATNQSNRINPKVRANAEEVGADNDLDGLPDSIDADDDGDLILDSADPDSEGADIPYTGLNLDFRTALNSNVRDGLTDEAIDATIGGENKFALTFFFSLPPESTVDSGHVICSDALSYCRPNTPLAYHGGVSESSSEFRRPWSELLNDDGYPRMEQISLGEGQAIVASIQPRVGRDQFRPGDMYRISLTNGSTEVSSRTMALAPYFVSIPAIKEYDAGFGTVAVDYDAVTPESGTIPGVGPGDPIVLSGTGTFNVTFWRPQRPAVRSDETGYYDQGNLNYGIVLDELQASCAGLYTSVSSDLVENDDALGEGGSPFPQDGAKFYPLVDSVGDRAADAAHTLTYTVDLKTCLSRASGTPGVHRVSFAAAGQEVTGGQSTAVAAIYVNIP